MTDKEKHSDAISGERLPKEALETSSVVPQHLNGSIAYAPFKPRPLDAHKGSFGHVLVVGGDVGYGGAVMLAARAAARTGAGLVSVATRRETIAPLLAANAEIMAQAIDDGEDLAKLLCKASVICIGPGLGQSSWSRALFSKVIDQTKPLVVDADALNLLAMEALQRQHWVLTPHPGEAARLLACSVAQVQGDRVHAVQSLQAQYGGLVILKGAGTLICDGEHPILRNTTGNAGMATAGMGDVLAGMIAGLIAQGFSLWEAACSAVYLHGKAGDVAAGDCPRGLMAGDLIEEIRKQVNPDFVIPAKAGIQ